MINCRDPIPLTHSLDFFKVEHQNGFYYHRPYAWMNCKLDVEATLKHGGYLL